VGRALAVLHENGILHLDVKPDNILVDKGETGIKLIDLGLARLRQGIAIMRTGTVGYMAPEVYDGYIDEVSDIYSLGVTIVQLLTGKMPGRKPKVQVDIPLNISKPFASAIARMVNLNPDERYMCAAEAVMALEGVSDQVAVSDLFLKNLKGKSKLISSHTSEEHHKTFITGWRAVKTASSFRHVRSSVFAGRKKELNFLEAQLKTAVKKKSFQQE
jgi:serine/threonine protein kinase